jgi:histone H3/H4
MKRLVKGAGAARVSEDAADALREVLEEFASDLATKAVQLAKHAGRKTITREDIKLAYRG